MADSLEQFTSKMLVENVFNCALCHNLLCVPVMKVENVGNVCNKCFDSANMSGLPNPELEIVLNELKIPCKFFSGGCKQRILFKDLEEHQEKCKYHEKPCVFGHCQWRGTASQISQHFLDKHNENVLHNFIIDLNITESNVSTKFLRGKKEFIVTIDLSVENDTISYSIYDAKHSETDYELIIKHLGLKNNIETICKVGCLTQKVEPVTVDFSALKQVLNVSETLSLEIKVNNNEMKEFDEKMLHFFECPVCKTLMRPPIYQCKFGHSFCNNCRPRLEKCPTCREPFGTTRNYSLEGLTAGISYSCIYHPLGCEQTLQASDTGKHESMCPFRPYHCPLDDCSFKGKKLNNPQKEKYTY